LTTTSAQFTRAPEGRQKSSANQKSASRRLKTVTARTTESDELPIYFSDLTPEAQKKVKKFLKIEAPEEANLDIFPLFVLPKPEC
jgi:septum formation topological specificity factor MinE